MTTFVTLKKMMSKNPPAEHILLSAAGFLPLHFPFIFPSIRNRQVDI